MGHAELWGGWRRAGALGALVAIFLGLAATGWAQEVDDDLKPQSQTQGVDMIKIAWKLLVKIVLPISGIAIAVYGIWKAVKRGEWFEGISTVAAGMLIVLLPAVIGYILNKDLYSYFGQ